MRDAQEAVPRLHPQLHPVFSTWYANFRKSRLGASVLRTRSLTRPGAHIDRVQRARRCQAERWGALGRHKHEDALGPVFKEEKEDTLVPIMPEERSSTACEQMLGLQERIPRLGSWKHF